jgi:hypothetical protein
MYTPKCHQGLIWHAHNMSHTMSHSATGTWCHRVALVCDMPPESCPPCMPVNGASHNAYSLLQAAACTVARFHTHENSLPHISKPPAVLQCAPGHCCLLSNTGAGPTQLCACASAHAFGQAATKAFAVTVPQVTLSQQCHAAWHAACGMLWQHCSSHVYCSFN